jgi:L-erythro-3,5-diaminohexanoate dehydrogenase
MTLTAAARGCRLGSHRVIEPAGALPQSARRIDNTPVPLANEILCDVDVLNIDSASFKQIADACGHDPQAIGEHVRATVAERGKQHNPVTGSGGMFVGRVRTLGSDLRARTDIAEGVRIASLVSLTLTPLVIDEVLDVDVATGRIWVHGQAILFESGLYARMPEDLPEDVALAVFDVAGAPAQVRRLTEPGHTVVVIGADGKSGLLSCAQARERAGAGGRVIGVVPDAAAPGAQFLVREGYVDTLITADARDALALAAAVEAAAPGLADLVVNCVNVAGTELGSILCTRDRGTVYFFSMATSFTAAALGAEGAGKDVTMIVGNGYAAGHAETAVQTLRDRPTLLALFAQRYGARTRS